MNVDSDSFAREWVGGWAFRGIDFRISFPPPPPSHPAGFSIRLTIGAIEGSATAMINEARAMVRAPVHLAAFAGVKRGEAWRVGRVAGTRRTGRDE